MINLIRILSFFLLINIFEASIWLLSTCMKNIKINRMKLLLSFLISQFIYIELNLSLPFVHTSFGTELDQKKAK